jgi:hypothetical protein
MVILLMQSKMRRKVVDAGRDQGNLDFRGTSVSRGTLVIPQDSLFFHSGIGHFLTPE